MTERSKSCCFTGHRAISHEHKAVLNKKLPSVIDKLISLGVTVFITGGALGFDTLAAQAVLDAKEKYPEIRLVLALPCKNQAINWNKSQIYTYNNILEKSDEVIYTSEEYTPECMRRRNRFMVDNSSYCVFFMTSPRGGTAYTVRYALEKNLNMINSMTEI